MLGAIIGDIVGSRFEFMDFRKKEFQLFTEDCDFTDDSILTVATADAILNGLSYKDAYLKWGRLYPNPKGCYGTTFVHWLMSPIPYNSFGNGAGMRVGPVGYLYNDEERVLLEASRSASVSHNHPEGIKGAQMIALSAFLLRSGYSKTDLYNRVSKEYDISDSVDQIRKENTYNESCQITVPQAIRCFLDSSNFEDAIRNAVSISGDSDTIAAMTGTLAEAFYGVSDDLIEKAESLLPYDMKTIITSFYEQYGKE